jgi:hypothetical protein
MGIVLLVLCLVVGGFAILRNLGDRVFSADLPAPLGEAITGGQLEGQTPYHVYVSAKNVPDRSHFAIRGLIQSSEGENIGSFSLETHDYEKWGWETDKGHDEWNTEKIAEFVPPRSGNYEIVLDELEIEKADYADMHEIYVWKPKVDI